MGLFVWFSAHCSVAQKKERGHNESWGKENNHASLVHAPNGPAQLQGKRWSQRQINAGAAAEGERKDLMRWKRKREQLQRRVSALPLSPWNNHKGLSGLNVCDTQVS